MNEKIIKVLNDIAFYEDYKTAVDKSHNGFFQARAYRKAVDTIKTLNFEIKDAEQIKGKPGIGSAIYEKIDSFLKTGTFPLYDEFKNSIVPELMPLLETKGIGMKRALIMFNANVSLDDLKNKQPGETISAPNIGSFTVTKDILAHLETGAHTEKTRMPISVHNEIVEPIMKELREIPGVVEVAATGSARRYDGSEGYTVGDADIIVGIENESPIRQIQAVMNLNLDVMPTVGKTKISGIKNGRQVDVRIVDIKDYGSLLLHCTGPAEFNKGCRMRAKANGWTLSEYGLFDASTGECISKDEREILRKLGIGWVDPKDRGKPEVLNRL